MTSSITPTQSNLTQAIGQFLMATLGLSPDQIIVGEGNRVAEPASPIFVVITPMRSDRLATNIDSFADVKFTGAITGTTLDVTNVAFGTIALGSMLFGIDVLSGTVITAFGTGSGGVGTYTVSQAQNVGSETLSAGTKALLLESRTTVQLDFHSADQSASDLAQTAVATLRDEYGVDFFAALDAPLNRIAPLYADDPRQAPFMNDQSQVEWRWSLDAVFQVNQSVSVPQQFGDSPTLTTIAVPEQVAL
ncbi:hypothetical protein IC762_17780 [Bradyrhizobium genosp. L]|uniref:phage neck terminator protein n=1 Tax=Bradyrhizobium genosp. L TaxID=83637 RepID=UPI0018A2EE8F|nr:hypothetical protein [Bradyrhizobium genosp. L]QPF81675.1 hypothetical protein IC762_17780 [Bradyrhizobium genosp. L]